MGYPCVRHNIFFLIIVQLFCIFLESSKYHKIIKIQNGRLTTILKLFAPKSYSGHWLT